MASAYLIVCLYQWCHSSQNSSFRIRIDWFLGIQSRFQLFCINCSAAPFESQIQLTPLYKIPDSFLSPAKSHKCQTQMDVQMDRVGNSLPSLIMAQGKNRFFSVLILKLCSTSAALMSSIHLLSCCGPSFVLHDDMCVGGIGNWRPLDKEQLLH